MKTEGRRQSENVEDRRDQRAGGFGARIPGGRVGAAGGAGLIIIVVFTLVFGMDPIQRFGGLEGGGTAVQTRAGP